MSDEVHVVIESLENTIVTLSSAVEQLSKAASEADSISISGDAELVSAIEHNRSEVLERINAAITRLSNISENLNEIMADTKAKKEAEEELH